MLRNFFLPLLFFGIINSTFASFPVTEKNDETFTTNLTTETNNSSLNGNLSLILSLIALFPWFEIGFFGWPLLFLSIPALILGIMSFNTKARLQGLIGSVIGFLHIVYWILVLLLFHPLFGW
tara:strand:+ start:232 stop:597 length:366 start_codon:yes stop_codon:yes gene_type:complete